MEHIQYFDIQGFVPASIEFLDRLKVLEDWFENH